MTYDAVPRLFVKLFTSDAIPELCLAFTILTAVRSQEARGARWDEFDFKAGVWTVPPSRMKRRREHRIPLSAEAVKLIQRLPRTGEYLFTANGNGSPIVAMSLRKALHRHGGDAFTVHGFRSAFRTWGGERSNAPRELLEVALSHAIGNQTEAAYARRSVGKASPHHAAMGRALRHAGGTDTGQGGGDRGEPSPWLMPPNPPSTT